MDINIKISYVNPNILKSSQITKSAFIVRDFCLTLEYNLYWRVIDNGQNFELLENESEVKSYNPLHIHIISDVLNNKNHDYFIRTKKLITKHRKEVLEFLGLIGKTEEVVIVQNCQFKHFNKLEILKGKISKKIITTNDGLFNSKVPLMSNYIKVTDNSVLDEVKHINNQIEELNDKISEIEDKIKELKNNFFNKHSRK